MTAYVVLLWRVPAVRVQTWVQDWIIDSALDMAIIRAMPAVDLAPSTPTPDHAIARVDCYESCLRRVGRSVQELGINYQILDLMAGFTDGYSASYSRTVGIFVQWRAAQ